MLNQKRRNPTLCLFRQKFFKLQRELIENKKIRYFEAEAKLSEDEITSNVSV